MIKIIFSIIITFQCSLLTIAEENTYFSGINYTNNITEERLKLFTKINVLELEKNNIRDELSENKVELKSSIQQLRTEIREQADNTNEIIKIYVWSFGIILALIGWAITFFGKSSIKKRVEEIIEEKATSYAELKTIEILNSKVNNGFISKIIRDKGEHEIFKLIEELNKKGHKTIQDIQKRGDEVIDSLYTPPLKYDDLTLDDNITKSDEEIIRVIADKRVDELFNLAFESKDLKNSVALYEKLLEIEPNNRYALNNIAVALIDLNLYSKAIIYLNKAIEINDQDALSFANRANAYNQLGELRKALEDAETAIKIDPKLEWAYSVKGNILTKNHRFDDAKDTLSKAIELNPESPSAYFLRGYLHEEIEMYSDSINDYLKAIELGFKNLPLIYNNLAVAYRRLRQFDKAVEFIKKARSINPEYPNLDGTMALIYADQGKEELFYEYVNKALKKGCEVWKYLDDSGFDNYRNSERLTNLLSPYRNA
jgi:tetratricopeptide (TPR) repeat protein